MKTASSLLAMFLALGFLAAAPSDADEVHETLRARIDQIHETGSLTIGSETIAATKLIATVYQARAFEPAWTDRGMITELTTAIAGAPRHGLDPSDYHTEAIRSRLETVAAGLRGVTSTVDLDLLLTDAFARYAFTLHFGKLNPEDLDPVWNLTREFSEDARGLGLFQEALSTGEITGFLRQAEAQLPVYDRLTTALERHHALADGGGWPSMPEGAILKPGDHGPRVSALRARLTASADLIGATAPDPEAYDDTVEAAVKRFQDRHGLDTDGKVGPKTVEALNISVETRIDQLRANLERIRWVARDVPEDFIIADIAGFRLHLFRDRKDIWSTRIQVGKPYHATPVFKDKMTYLVLNPTWTIPPGILRKETLPAARKDPNYLKDRNMSVIRSDGSVVDPSTVDFQGKFPYGIRQEPGPNNALGRVKFIFPNKHFVYFHDTPSKSLFGRSARAFSHGCIRTEDPLHLAELLLADQGWDRARIDKVIDSAKMTTVTLEEPMTVFLLYFTAVVREDGTVEFREDIYDRDGKIIKGLNADIEFEAPGRIPAELQ